MPNIVGARYLPLALYVHEQYANHSTELLGEIDYVLKDIYSSKEGDDNARRHFLHTSILVLKTRSVIVLGGYRPDLRSEIENVRDALAQMGYEANLLWDLPDFVGQSTDQKLRLWTSAARFCVMIDRDAAGHLSEYPVLRDQRTPLALLRAGSGSSRMIGEDNLPFIKAFTFERSPLECLKQAIAWAESYF